MLRGWSVEYYNNTDCFEAGLDSRKLRKKMSKIREEFYGHSQYPVVRPSSVAVFLYIHRRWTQLHKKDIIWSAGAPEQARSLTLVA